MEPVSSGSRTSETKYERLRRIGIGSYGVVFKCVNRQTRQIVAIKRYSENDSDPVIRKIAMREVRMLRQLKHPNLIRLLEVFRRKRILHLVFDYCELTVLDVIERYANNCPLNLIRKIIWQLVNGVSHCHSHNCIHRDIKPENILINQAGIVKLCDFGFARNLNNPISKSAATSSSSQSSQQREFVASQQRAATGMAIEKENLIAERQALTEYVATRWYRAPELLVGDVYYDTKIDIWAIGCVAAELMRGEPLWPGKTDLEQLCLIKNSLGPLTHDQKTDLLLRGLYEPAKIGRCLGQTEVLDPLERKLPSRVGQLGINFVLACLEMDPARRPTSDKLLKHDYIHSSLMGQFVRSAVSGHGGSGSRSLQRAEQDSAASSRQERPVGHEVLVGHSIEPIGQAQAVHRSNSQAILRAAASQQQQQQPPSKRLVVGANPSNEHHQKANGNQGDPRARAVSFKSASKQLPGGDLGTNQPGNTHQTRRKPMELSRSQSQSTAINEAGAVANSSGAHRVLRTIPSGGSHRVLQPRRTNANPNRVDQERARQTTSQQRTNNANDGQQLVERLGARGRAKKTHKLPAGDREPAARNANDNSPASTSNSTTSSITPSSMSTSRHDKSLASSLLPPLASGTSSLE